MRIGFFTDTYRPMVDGVVISIDLLRAELEKMGHEVFVICPEYPEATDDDERIIRLRGFDPLRFSPFNSRVVMGDPRARKKIEKLNLDLIHTHTQFSAGLLGSAISRRKKIPHVTTYHTHLNELINFFPISFHLASPLAIGLFTYQLKKLKPVKEYMKNIAPTNASLGKRLDALKRIYFDEADAVIANSQHMLEHLTSLQLNSPVTLIKNGIDTKSFVKGTAWSGSGTLEMAIVARMSAEKRQDTLIEAVAELVRRDYDVRLHVAGDGPHAAYCEQLVKELELESVVIFHGSLSQVEVRKLLARAHLGLFASYNFDTYPLTLLEYLAAGLPSVYCDKNFVDMGSEQSMRICKPDAHSFTEAIIKLHDPKILASMSTSALQDAKQHDISQRAIETEALYDQVVSLR